MNAQSTAIRALAKTIIDMNSDVTVSLQRYINSLGQECERYKVSNLMTIIKRLILLYHEK